MDTDSTSHDLVFSEAFKVLDALVDSNEVSLDDADKAKRKYEQLHATVLKAMAAEKQHLDEAKVLKKRLEDGAAGETVRSGDDDLQTALQVLREDEEAAQAEVAIAQEEEQLQQAEVAELTRQRDETKEHFEAVQEEHRQRLLPYIHELQEEVSALQSEVDGKQSKVVKYLGDCQELKEKVNAAESCKDGLTVLRSQFNEELRKAESVPEKAARQAQVVQSLCTQLEAQHKRVTDEFERAENNLRVKKEEIQQLEAEHASTMVEVERAEYALEAQERSADQVQKQFHIKHFDAEQIIGQQAEFEVQLRLRQSDLMRCRGELNTAVQEKDRLIKRCKKLDNVLKIVQATMPSMQTQKDQLCIDLKRTEEQTRRTQDDIKLLKTDVDLHMMLYLNEEAGGKEKNTLFIISHEQIVELEHSISEFRKVEAQSLRALHDASSSRDRAARQSSMQLRKLKESKKQGMLKEMIGRDLKKRRRAIIARVKDFQQLYDLVKNQRNRFVNLIQAARQGIAEMKEKLRISTNELEILRAESAKKDHLLVQRRAETQKEISYRNSMRAKVNGVRIQIRERQDRVDEQVAEIEKHNSIITTAEKDMIRMRKQYEVIVELRNYTGVMLIDRNDELCVLYEKSNVQESVSKHGDTGLVRMEDEIRLLKINVLDAERNIRAVRKKQPKAPALDHSVAQLQKDILVTRQQGEELAAQLEDPQNPQRWRALPGRIKDKDELRIKINQLEERLNGKKEQLLERELILEEVTNLSNALRLQAIAGKADTLDVAQKANDYQSQLRTTKRKMMATISELSMYQATVLKLSAEKESVAKEVQEARLRLADGEAPTTEFERDWHAAVRAEATAERMQAEQKERLRILAAKGTMTATSAEPRPHAYIPEKLGIPKPYGTFEPFKPMEPGSTMRHIRKPEPKPIVI